MTMRRCLRVSQNEQTDTKGGRAVRANLGLELLSRKKRRKKKCDLSCFNRRHPNASIVQASHKNSKNLFILNIPWERVMCNEIIHGNK